MEGREVTYGHSPRGCGSWRGSARCAPHPPYKLLKGARTRRAACGERNLFGAIRCEQDHQRLSQVKWWESSSRGGYTHEFSNPTLTRLSSRRLSLICSRRLTGRCVPICAATCASTCVASCARICVWIKGLWRTSLLASFLCHLFGKGRGTKNVL